MRQCARTALSAVAGALRLSPGLKAEPHTVVNSDILTALKPSLGVDTVFEIDPDPLENSLNDYLPRI